MNAKKIRVAVFGAAGRMGMETVKTVMSQKDMELTGAFDVRHNGEDSGTISCGTPNGVKISEFTEAAFASAAPDVTVDFTAGTSACSNIIHAVENGSACVVGTTGLKPDEMSSIENLSNSRNIPVLIAPNFSIGAVLMMKFAKEAAEYMEWGEIIELHHENKLDAPSGTAMRTADLMSESRKKFNETDTKTFKLDGARGGEKNGIHIHSVRLPGLLAHQEVIFGGLGETLTVRHDSISRESFMPGVMLAIRKIKSCSGFVTGLENLM